MEIGKVWATRQAEYKASKGKSRVEYVRFSLVDGECASQKFVEFDNRKNTAKVFSDKPRFWKKLSKKYLEYISVNNRVLDKPEKKVYD